ncbi:peptidase C39 family protein, partial [Extibacter muris]|nr:peptidase C39 family protein [Extibacter muris]
KKNDEAIDFIYEYPKEHSIEHDIDLTAEASQDTVPLLQQWDKRWGYEKYSGNYFAASGCGPTALSMVVLYL